MFVQYLAVKRTFFENVDSAVSETIYLELLVSAWTALISRTRTGLIALSYL